MGQQKPFFRKATAKLGQIFETAKFIVVKTLKDKDFLQKIGQIRRINVTSHIHAGETRRHSNQRYQV